MFTKEKMLRRTNSFNACYKEKDGMPYLGQNPMIFPDVWEIKKKAVNEILSLGFTLVLPVEPNSANCIIRIFTKRHFKYNDEIHNVYGFQCYVKEKGIWISEMDNVSQINFARCEIVHVLNPKESIEYDCDYIDLYVKVV